jgi:hypothetical protein
MLQKAQWSNYMLRRWLLSSLFEIGGLVAILVVWIAHGVMSSHTPVLTAIGIVFLCLIVRSVTNLWRLFGGTSLMIATANVNLSGGSLSLAIGDSDLHLWLFLDQPLAFFHGRIILSTDGLSEAVNLPARHGLLYPVRATYTPFYWHGAVAPSARELRVEFHFVPTFEGTLFGKTLPRPDLGQRVTIVVKKRRRRRCRIGEAETSSVQTC